MFAMYYFVNKMCAVKERQNPHWNQNRFRTAWKPLYKMFCFGEKYKNFTMGSQHFKDLFKTRLGYFGIFKTVLPFWLVNTLICMMHAY